MRKNSFLTGTLILVAAGLISRLLGFLYRIYISNIMGSEGMGLYQLISPVYFLAYTFCASGIYLAISKLVAAEKANRNDRNMSRILLVGCFMAAISSLFFVGLLITQADFIAVHFLHDSRTASSIRIVSLALPFCVTSSCIKAYFYGIQKMTVPAIDQVLEQVSRMLVIFFIAPLMVPKGLEAMCKMAVIGTVAGDTVSCLYASCAYSWERKKSRASAMEGQRKATLALITALLAMAIPLTANRAISQILSSFENIMIPSALKRYGLDASQSLSLFGEFSGMAMPIITFPSLLTSALSMNLLPMVAQAQAVSNNHRIQSAISKSLRFTFLIAFLFTALFATLGRPLGLFLYHQPTVGSLLFILSFLCPFLYLQSTLGGLLNGLGLHNYSFLHNLISDALRILILLYFVPQYGFNAFIAGMFLSSILASILNLRKLLSTAGMRLSFNQIFFKPLLAAAASILVSVFLGSHLIYPHFSLPISILLLGLICSLLYFLGVLGTSALSKNDMQEIKKMIH